MTRYFAQNTPRAGLEHMMMSVPGFQKRGGGMMILSRFCYKPEDVDCRYCLHYRAHSLFFTPENEGQDFNTVLQDVQEYISGKYSALITEGGGEDAKAQIKRYITKYVQDRRIAVKGYSGDQLVDALYTEMAEFGLLTKYIFGTGIEEINVNSWRDSRLLGIDSIDEYIRYGGTLRAGELAFDDEDVNAQDASFRDDESTRRYIDTAICKNIQHSLACYESGGHFRHLYSLYEAGELTSAINRIIEDMNHRFLISVLTDDFLSHDLRLTAANLRKERDPEKRTEALDAIDTEAVTRRLMELLDIRNKEEQSIGITTAHIIEIKQYLAALELIVDCPIESADPGIEPVEHILFTQPGMRYCQAQALVHSLLKDEQFSALSEYDKMQITGRILEEVRGRMMEDIVLLETMKAADKDHRVFKLQFEAGEFDMVIYDQKENSCEIFEIKHSSKQVPLQYRHLVDEDKCQRTERRFGPIQGRYILYRGEDAQMENGVQYWNVENYLKALPTLDIVQVQEIGMQPIEPTL